MARKYFLLAVAAAALACAQGNQTQALRKLFADAYRELLREHPESATQLGIPGYNDRWTDRSAAGIERRKSFYHRELSALAAIPRDGLNQSDQLHYDVFQRFIQSRLDQEDFQSLYMTTNQMQGVHLAIANVFDRAPARTVKDYEDRIARMRAVPKLLEQSTEALEGARRKGISPPKIVLRYLPAQLESQTPADPTKSPLLEAFTKMPADIPAAARDRLKTEAAKAYTESMAPALRKYRQYLTDVFIPAARQSTALSDVPGGKQWYAMQVRLMTTTPMTPQQIHDTGLSEVKRIKAEMEKVKDAANFKGSLADFQAFLTKDPQFFYQTPAELLTGYREIAKRADPEMPKLFGKLPRMPYGVVAIPDYQAPASAAHYSAPSLDGTRAGYFWAKTYKPEKIPKWTMESLVMHESVPGHHMQIALSLEIQDMPDFRKLAGLSAYSEGWGLYAESLGEEIGFYADPYSKYGKLNSELFRACRLVVDTGLHAFGWSRQQALDYFQQNIAQDETSEVDRYIAWPGQAVSYKIGELKIKELRTKAEKSLGAQFQLREFHDVVLGNGALPLDLLEQQVDRWIAAKTGHS